MTSYILEIGELDPIQLKKTFTSFMQIPISLRHRKFLVFWLGTIFGWIGNQVLIWAIPWHIRSFTDDPMALGIIGIIRLAPTLLFSLFSGVVADSINRRKIILVTQTLMGTTALVFFVLTRVGIIQLWHIYLLLMVHATSYIFELPARYSITPNLVPGKDLPNALSVELLGIQIGSLLGPLISGTVIDQFRQSSAYMVSSVLFLLFILVLIALGNIPQVKLPKVKPGIDWISIKEGLRFTLQHPLIFPSMLLDFMATLLTRADSLMPFFARDILNLSAGQYGWLSAASAIGAVTTGVILSQLKTFRNQGATLLSAVGMIGIGAVVFGYSRSFPLSMTALILVGASDHLSSVLRSAIRQQHTADKLRGRMTSVNQIFFMGGPYLGDVKSGLLGKLIGVPLAVSLGGLACIFSVAWIARRWSHLPSYDGHKNQT
jgi:MFS family permease